MAGVVSGANISGGADPRSNSVDIGHLDRSLDKASFEEYLYWAKVSRADQRYEHPTHDYTFFGKVLKKSRHPTPAEQLAETKRRGPGGAIESPADYDEKNEKKALEAGDADNTHSRQFAISDEEWVNASRALRTATWGGVFYLITTDVLGPFGMPWGFAATGYGPGVALNTVLGAGAFYGGICLWRCFMQLDSDRYPLSSYGDMAYRIYGEWARVIVNFLQFVQLWFNVAIICVVNAQNLEQILVNGYKTPVCYVVCILIWAIVGMVGGQIRTLQNLSWIANLSIWLNLFIIFGSMGIIAQTGINAEDAIPLNAVFNINPGDPVVKSAGAPYGTSVTVLGLTVMVFSWGGATVFVEFMAEMKRPMDFWKAMFCAQLFIYFFYMLFGLFVYSYQGQYTINPTFQGIAEYNWQAAMDGIQIVTGTIGGLLYGNIAIKILYNQVLLRYFRFPHLASRAGKLSWVAIVPIFWALSFVLGAAVPQISTLQGFIGAIAIFQFSYTFPPMLLSGLLVKREAMLEGDGYDPATGATVRQDSGFQRWMRGYKKYFVFNTFNVILVLASFATAGIGAWAGILGIQATFAAGVSTSFTCASPFDAPQPGNVG